VGLGLSDIIGCSSCRNLPGKFQHVRDICW
jgi:hypothetical protein